MAYDMYFDKELIPVTPAKVQIKVNNQNRTMTLIDEGEINLLKKPGLTDVSFTLLLPMVKYPFAKYKGSFKKANVYLDLFEALKTSQKPFQWILSRTMPNGKLLFDTNMKVSLEDYRINEDRKEGFDITVEIKLRQYRDFGTKTVQISEGAKPVAVVESTRETDNSPAPKTEETYTVVAGDTLWLIAKKFYGDGAKYGKIADTNKNTIASPNVIHAGQVLIIPALS